MASAKVGSPIIGALPEDVYSKARSNEVRS